MPVQIIAGFRPPTGACDSHCHIVGPQSRFPITAGGPHRAEDATKEMLIELHTKLGIDRAVIVHSARHGTDLSTTIEALSFAPKRFRGVALLNPSVTDRQLERLNALGFRGVRHNLLNQPQELNDIDAFLKLGERIAQLGWHYLIHIHAEQIHALHGVLKRLKAPIVIDHLMRLNPRKGENSRERLALLQLLRDGAWIKIAAVDKLSREPYPHLDAVDLAARLIDAAPDQVIWGTDWPHPDGRGLRGGERPDDGQLLDLTPLYAPDPVLLRKLLKDNPARLYGFEAN